MAEVIKERVRETPRDTVVVDRDDAPADRTGPGTLVAIILLIVVLLLIFGGIRIFRGGGSSTVNVPSPTVNTGGGSSTR